jgi:holo-[acyl-carrier protein] synthase
MARGLGIDAIEIERIRAVRKRHGMRFLRKVFTESERRHCLAHPDPDSSLAGRFAAKEALLKALGTGMGSGIGWRDVVIVPAGRGIPRVELRGAAADRMARLGASTALVSITHTRELAMDQALLV